MNKIVWSDEPKVFTIDNFITDIEKLHFMKLGLPQVQASVVSDDKGGYISGGRTSKTAWIKKDNDEIVLGVAKRIAELIEYPIENAEAFQFVSYDENGEYRQHYDSWENNGSEKTLRCVKYGGPRMITTLIYLNKVSDGGETTFTKLNINVKPDSGKLLVFENTCRDSIDRHPLSEHAGMPVKKGRKFILNLWFRHKNTGKLYSETNPDYY